MEISYFGKTTVRIKGKNSAILIDPSEAVAKLEADVIALTSKTVSIPKRENAVLIAGPGEYEVKGIHVVGVTQKLSETDESKDKITAYLINVDNLNVLHLATFTQTKLDDEQLENFENVDVLLVPLGSKNGLESAAAAKLAAQLEVGLVVPFYPDGNRDTFESAFLKDMGKGTPEPTKKLIMTRDKLPEEAQVVLLETS